MVDRARRVALFSQNCERTELSLDIKKRLEIRVNYSPFTETNNKGNHWCHFNLPKANRAIRLPSNSYL
ncbi:24895_t:CDS:1 [Gigaspora rosea]|nr:24895_t:CDS:1 [Gigaspora rosea]